MSGDFTYVWDAALHGVPETLEQANEMFEHFRAVAREHRTFEQLPKLNTYAGALERYYEQHDLDRHSQPEFEDIDRRVLIIEEGLTVGSAQHYHAVQLAVEQGLVYFEVDANMAFLPDGRVLPESRQFAWQQHGLRLAQEASKPEGQVFPRTEKELIKKLYNTMDGFITKHGFNKDKYGYRITKKMVFGELRSYAKVSINSMGTTIMLSFTADFKPRVETNDYDHFKNASFIAHLQLADLLKPLFEGKFSGVEFFNNAHWVSI